MPLPATRAIAAACFAAAIAFSTGQAVAANTVTAQVTNGTLQVTGTSGADTIVLVLSLADHARRRRRRRRHDRLRVRPQHVHRDQCRRPAAATTSCGQAQRRPVHRRGDHDRRRRRRRHAHRRRRRRRARRRHRRRLRRRQPRQRHRSRRRRRRHVPLGPGRRQRHGRGPGRQGHRSHFNGSNAGENIDLSANGSRVRLFRDVAAITHGPERDRDVEPEHARQRRHRHRRRPRPAPTCRRANVDLAAIRRRR